MSRRILFLAHRVPFPPDRGDRIRAFHLLKALSTIGDLHIGALSDEDVTPEQRLAMTDMSESWHVARDAPSLPLAGLRAVGTGRPVSLTAFASTSLKRWVARTIAEQDIDTLFVFSGQMGQYVPDWFEGRVVVDLCDVDSAKFAQYAREAGLVRAVMYRREARLLEAEERRLIARADCTTLISQEEAALLPGAPMTVLPNGVDADYFDPTKVEPEPALQDHSAYVFVGQMDYPPNAEAVRRFATHILPRLQEKQAAQFHIVGRAPTAEVKALGGDAAVTVWGGVPDVRPYLAAARAVVAPLMLARGVQNKVLEAMAMARPVLLSPEAATGIPLKEGVHATVCRDDEGFIDAALDLHDTGAAARAFVVERMSWEATYAQVRALVEAVPDKRHAA